MVIGAIITNAELKSMLSSTRPIAQMPMITRATPNPARHPRTRSPIAQAIQNAAGNVTPHRLPRPTKTQLARPAAANVAAIGTGNRRAKATGATIRTVNAMASTPVWTGLPSPPDHTSGTVRPVSSTAAVTSPTPISRRGLPLRLRTTAWVRAKATAGAFIVTIALSTRVQINCEAVPSG